MHHLPTPSDFGLPENLEQAYKSEEKYYIENSKKLYRKRHTKSYILALLVTYLACFIFSPYIDGVYSLTDKLSISAMLTFCITGWVVIPDWIFCISLRSPQSEFWKSEFYTKYCQYKKAVKEYHRLEAAQTESFWLNQSGHQFEHEVAKVYQSFGYKTVISKAGGDGGIDIILTKGNERIAVQCKHHSKAVSPAVARDLYGTMLANNFPKGILVSLNGFTKGTKDFVAGKPIQLVDMNDLIRMSEHPHSIS